MSDSVDPAMIRHPEAHGRAAMLLVESLIRGLISRSALTVGEAIDIIDGVAEVEDELRARSIEAGQQARASLFNPLAKSLRFDLGG